MVVSTRYGGSRVSIFTKDGYFVGDVRTATVRSWTMASLGVIGRCDFDMSMLDPKTSEKFLQFGMYVLVRHETLPDWIGVIYTPRVWSGEGILSIRAYQAEQVLKWRRTPVERVLSDTAGEIFKQILAMTNAAEFNEKPFAIGNIEDGDSIQEVKLGDDAYAHIQKIAEGGGYDFEVAHEFDTNGRLFLRAHWYTRRGKTTGMALREGANIERSDSVLEEQGDIFNDLIGHGDASTETTRFFSRAYDLRSISKYGLFQHSVVYPGVVRQSALDQKTLEELQKRLDAERVVNLAALNVGTLFQHLRIGNVFDLDLNYAGFQQFGYGLNAAVRIIGMEYDDHTDRVELVTEVQDAT